MKQFEALPLYDRLTGKILSYYATVWKDKLVDGMHVEWLSNFRNDDDQVQRKEQINALYLLSKFMYFGNTELRELLRCIYRDLFKYRVIRKIREENSDTTDSNFLAHQFRIELNSTRFLGVGNPSESGVHLLYYFRQENKLSKHFFINPLDIFQTQSVKTVDEEGRERVSYDINLAEGQVKRYIFIDDFCGSGTQAKEYSEKIVELIKNINPAIEVSYLMLFGTETGIQSVKDETKFDVVEAIYTIDESFKCFSDASRYYSVLSESEEVDKSYTEALCRRYGNELFPGHPLGYKDCQLLLALFHNTPDNTLPIFWSSDNWSPIFKRYSKF